MRVYGLWFGVFTAFGCASSERSTPKESGSQESDGLSEPGGGEDEGHLSENIEDDAENEDTGLTDIGDEPSEPVVEDTGDIEVPQDEPFIPDWPEGSDPFADRIVSFDPGPDAGFGSDRAPDIVLGWPDGGGARSGSIDVLSLGESGVIVLEMTDLMIVDGPGADLLVFENPFSDWFEAGAVAVSMDGENWSEWPCDAENEAGLFPGCAGVGHVFASPSDPFDPTDPELAGGDAFDLAELGLAEARFVRIRDTGFNIWGYGGNTGGFDLDAIAAVNWSPIDESE